MVVVGYTYSWNWDCFYQWLCRHLSDLDRTDIGDYVQGSCWADFSKVFRLADDTSSYSISVDE